MKPYGVGIMDDAVRVDPRAWSMRYHWRKHKWWRLLTYQMTGLAQTQKHAAVLQGYVAAWKP